MSSWLVSLSWIDGSAVRLWRCLEKHGLRASCVRNGLFDAGPCRLVAEPRAQVVQHRCNLVVVHAVSEARHDQAAFSLHRANARQDEVGEVARIWASDSGAKAKIDSTKRQRPVGLVTSRADRGVDRCAGRVDL